MAMIQRNVFKRSIISAALLLAVSVCGATPGLTRTPYDGLWSVLIITDAGTCDRGYRYALQITNGRVTYDDPSFNVTGRVMPGGQVRVSIAYGQSLASGSGRLTSNYGTGVWSGHSATARCSGHWEAERRG